MAIESPARAPKFATSLAEAAGRWLSTLDASQRARAQFPFASDERVAWDYRPGPRGGLALQDMHGPQREAALRVLTAALSERGAAEAQAIMALETVLGEIERSTGRGDGSRRNPALYWFALFGEPGRDEPWAWRVGGHHVAVHVTVIARTWAAVTPLFLGANPATVPHGAHAGRRTLAAEEDLARELLRTLTPAERAVAVVAPVAPADILTGTTRRVDPAVVPRGIRYGALGGAPRERLVRLVRHYVDRVAPAVAEAEWRRIETAGLEEIAFAWAGPLERGHGHYYAVGGTRFVIEYDNTQNDANHIHSVWRDLTRDWGEDLLAAHYAAAHR